MGAARISATRGAQLIAALSTVLVIAAPGRASGQTVTAMWDPSPAADLVTGYQVCVGTSSLACNGALTSVGSSATAYRFFPSGGVMLYVAVRAVSAAGSSAYSPERSFSIPGFTQPTNRSSTVGVAISPLTLSVSDPDGSSLSYTHTGLPSGLTLSQTTGQISGTPSAVGTYPVTVFVADDLATISRSFTWTVTAGAIADTMAPSLAITSHTSGQSFHSSVLTIGGTASDSGRGGSGITSVKVNGQLASGSTVSGTGTANWSRSLTLTKGWNTITVEARDGAGNITMQQITLSLKGNGR